MRKEVIFLKKSFIFYYAFDFFLIILLVYVLIVDKFTIPKIRSKDIYEIKPIMLDIARLKNIFVKVLIILYEKVVISIIGIEMSVLYII